MFAEMLKCLCFFRETDRPTTASMKYLEYSERRHAGFMGASLNLQRERTSACKRAHSEIKYLGQRRELRPDCLHHAAVEVSNELW